MQFYALNNGNSLLCWKKVMIKNNMRSPCCFLTSNKGKQFNNEKNEYIRPKSSSASRAYPMDDINEIKIHMQYNI